MALLKYVQGTNGNYVERTKEKYDDTVSPNTEHQRERNYEKQKTVIEILISFGNSGSQILPLSQDLFCC